MEFSSRYCESVTLGNPVFSFFLATGREVVVARALSESHESSVQHVIDLMRRFAAVRARAMFGGHGLYREELMFALLADGGLYFKTDAETAPVFDSHGLRPFSFTARGRTVNLSYREAPPQALEDEAEMTAWCQLAWQAALRAKAAGAGGRRRPPLAGLA